MIYTILWGLHEQFILEIYNSEGILINLIGYMHEVYVLLIQVEIEKDKNFQFLMHSYK